MAVPGTPGLPSTARKTAISVALGLACVARTFRTISASFPPHEITIVWSLFLPMLAALAWGWRYALVAATVGGAGFAPLLLWPANGYANLGAFALYAGWLVWHGAFADARRVRPAAWNHPYAAQLAYTPVIFAILLVGYPPLFGMNPPPWAADAPATIAGEVLRAIAVKETCILFLHIVLCGALLRIVSVRRAFSLPVSDSARLNFRITAGSIVAGFALYLGFVTLGTIMSGRPVGSLSWRELVVGHEELLVFVAVLSLVGGAQLAKYVERRLEVEAALRSSEARARTIFNSVNDAIFIHDSATARIVDVNSRACEMFGYAAEEFGALEIGSLSVGEPPFSRDEASQIFRDAPWDSPRMLEWRAKRRDGTPFWAEVNLRRVVIGGVERVLVVVRDITERRKLEAQLRQSQKMEAIGQLAGGVAHDFNNLLTAITGYGSLLALELGGNPSQAEMIEQILRAADKSSKLTGQLLAFSRNQAMAPKLTDVNELVRGIEKLLRRVIGEDIDVRTSLATGELRAMVDPIQIEQVLMNLATNARDAMPDGGVLSITTERADATELFATLHGLPSEGAYCLIKVADSGAGMSEETRQKLFDPFFTTKEVGKGTGLGLSIVYGIVRQHRGAVSVYSEPGHGSTFRVFLPLSDEAARGREARGSAPAPGRGETILLAEDNDEVREFVTLLLRRSGYQVVVAVNGEEAVARFREQASSVALVLLDVIMPKKSGKEAWDEIRSMRPATKALFFSGYTADIIGQKGLLDGGVELLSKPVAPDELLAKVRAAIDREG